MHIPDGMLDTKTFSTLWGGAAASIGYASYWVRKNFNEKKIVLMAVLGALIFALQMLNFPVAGGTSGHFVGAALAGILLGSWPGVIVMTAVLLIQALFFGDGGITTLGANIINMAVIGVFIGPFIYHLITRFSSNLSLKIVGAAIGSWLSVVLSAAAVAIELWISGSAQFFVALSSMVFWYAIIGVGEAIITAGIVVYIAKVRPEIVEEGHQQMQKSWVSVSVVLSVITVIAVGLSFLASSYPDGLEFVYFNMGIGSTSVSPTSLLPAPLSNYLVSGITNNVASGIAAGIIGIILTGLVLLAVARLLARHREKQAASDVSD